MDFSFTPDEAQLTARQVFNHFKEHGITLGLEKKVFEDAPLRTTLSGNIKGVLKLIEVQEKLSYKNIRELALWLGSKRHYAELILAVPENAEIPVGVLAQMENDGVGLIAVNSTGKVNIIKDPINYALMVTPDPSLKYGRCTKEVCDAVEKFNTANRKDGIRDMCELVERETEKLIIKASRTGNLNLSERIVTSKDWAGQIDILASQNACNPGKTPLFDEKLKLDMHSFRGARNLFDHKVKTKKADIERNKQCAERMMQGPRLIAKILSLQRKST